LERRLVYRLTWAYLNQEKFIMDSHVYKTIQITGSSTSSADEAVRTAVERAAKTVHNLKWFKVTETRGYIKDGHIADWQVSVELGFALE
jgi:flavin-binding protein dodecin